MNDKNLTEKTIKGFIWLLGSSGIQSILRLVFVAVLARLLSPQDFGLIATAMLIINLTELIAQIGVGPALVQKRDITEKHISSAFTFTILTGPLLYVIFLIINPYIALFFKMQELTAVLNLLCLILPFRMFSQISYSMLQRNFLFKKLAGWDAFSYGVGYGVVGITLASLGFGVYALVWGSVAQSIIYSFILYLINPHPLKIGLHKKETKELLTFGSGFTLSSIFNYFARNGDYLIVGKFIGAAQLGLYSRAYGLMNVADKILGSVINKVMFPAFSDIQNDKEKLNKGLERGFGLMFLLLLPVTSFCFVFANEIILVLLGEKWLSAVIPYKILLLGMVSRVGYKITGIFIKSIGKVYINSAFQFIYMSLILLGSFLIKDFGIIGVSAVVSLTLIINFSIQLLFLFKVGFMNYKQIVNLIFASFPITILVVMISVVLKLLNVNFVLSAFFSLSISLLLILGITSLIVFYKNNLFLTVNGVWLIKRIKILKMI